MPSVLPKPSFDSRLDPLLAQEASYLAASARIASFPLMSDGDGMKSRVEWIPQDRFRGGFRWHGELANPAPDGLVKSWDGQMYRSVESRTPSIP